MKWVILIALIAVNQSSAGTRKLYQPVIDYCKTLTSDQKDSAPPINSFENFTNLATDFGWMGPGEARIDLKDDMLVVHPTGEWTGAWHSVAGLAVERDRLLDFSNILGFDGQNSKKSKIVACVFHAGGMGEIRIELANADRNILWSQTITLNSDEITEHTIPIKLADVKKVKFINWVSEENSRVNLISLGFSVEIPEMSLEEWVFQISMAKLKRCHDPLGGFTRDRGHLPAGKFDSIASTGMYTLAAALAVEEGFIHRDAAVNEIETTKKAVISLPKAKGFFPHFTHKDLSNHYTIYPSTEFSTVDTAIALHSMLLATHILNLEDMNQKIIKMISEINFDATIDPDGWIRHGYHDNTIMPLAASWRDWGGETALVLALEAMIPNRKPRAKMMATGQVYRGVGFIAEIQSLFYRDFDQPIPDLVSQISWPAARMKLLDQQLSYAERNWPTFGKTGIFGLSAGESGMPGAGYTANGSEVLGVRWIHPHYMIMSLALSAPERYAAGLKNLDNQNFLYPFGLPENIEVDLKLQNPMQGSLNAAFETLAAYHGWRKRGVDRNAIDKASLTNVSLRKGISRFYSPTD